MKTDSACGERQDDGNFFSSLAFCGPSQHFKFLGGQADQRGCNEQALGKQGMDFMGQPQHQPRFFVKILGMDRRQSAGETEYAGEAMRVMHCLREAMLQPKQAKILPQPGQWVEE